MVEARVEFVVAFSFDLLEGKLGLLVLLPEQLKLLVGGLQLALRLLQLLQCLQQHPTNKTPLHNDYLNETSMRRPEMKIG